MWLLMIIVFSGPMEINTVDVVETHYSEKACVSRAQEAQKLGLPENANVGCVHLKEVKKA